MSPEKVAILVVAGLIAVLLAVALLGTESNGNGSAPPTGRPAAAPERPKTAPKQIESYTYEDIVKGAGRTRPEPKHAPVETRPEAATVDYVVRKDDTLEKIARRELGSREQVSRIIALNKGINPSRLKIGAKIRLPAVKADQLAEAAKPKATGTGARKKNEPVTAKAKSL
jgi:LysM repeat protein